MSWPKAGVRLPEGPRSMTVRGVDREARKLRVEYRGPEKWHAIWVPFEDVKWINTEAANTFDLHDLKVIGVGYGADQKQQAYEESRRG